MILIAITAILNGFFCKLQSPLVSKVIIILTATPNQGFQKDGNSRRSKLQKQDANQMAIAIIYKQYEELNNKHWFNVQ